MSIQDTISIKGARQHNLKNIDLDLPKNKFVVLTGMSGSGKSSLAFDTLYAEGQRRYVESLSSYARQFLGVMSKPDVDFIGGLSPAISIDQKTTSHNPRSTVGTITEIYDYLRLLYARIGRPHCPQCGKEIKQQSIEEMVDAVFSQLSQRVGFEPVRFMVLSPVVQDRKGEYVALFENIKKKGYSRVRVDGVVYGIDEDFVLLKNNKHTISVVMDRFVVDKTVLRDLTNKKDTRSRLWSDLEQALKLSDGSAIISFVGDPGELSFPDKPTQMEDVLYSEKFACSECGISLGEIEPRIFSFNTPHGACPVCNGLGSLLKVDPQKIIAPSLTLSEGAIIPFERVMNSDTWFARLIETVVGEYGGSIRQPYESLSAKVQNVVLYGDMPKRHTVYGQNRFGNNTQIEEQFPGLLSHLERKYRESESEFVRSEIERYMRKEICHSCQGARLRKESLAISVDGKNIAQACQMPINQMLPWVNNLMESGVELKLMTPKQHLIASSILKEIHARLQFLVSVGLTYLTLSRESGTLAGGEAQRIRLASQIGSGLTGVLYILDEPTIGLHQRDNHQLIQTLKTLRDLGNSVIVVEHDRDTIMAADWVVDFGPKAGSQGGRVVSQGTPQQIMKDSASLTGKYLSDKKKIVVRKNARRTTKHLDGSVLISGASEHNLKRIDVDVPLSKLVCITGVSGSGKSTLLHDCLYQNLAKELGYVTHDTIGKIDGLTFDRGLKRVVLIDQSPIGKTPRSNPATYTKIFDLIRTVFSQTKDSHSRGYKSGRFSFNVKGGRCEACSGEGQVKIEMQFLADIYVTCDVCHGSRYNAETLEVRYKEKNIAQVLDMTIDEAISFFGNTRTIQQKLTTLQEVGLGYMKLGQSAPTLSGGEAQRVKLARELSVRSTEHTMYLLDEPTTGLHFEDIANLLNVLQSLVEVGNSVVLIEHNLDVIKNADWIIDLGPQGGDEGGRIVAQGSPSQIADQKQSVTGTFLKGQI